MRRIAAAIVLAGTLALGAREGNPQAMLLTGVGSVVSAASYTGPIDIVASPTAFYSLRAGSSAIAVTGTQKLVDLRRPSDNATCTATITNDGLGNADLTVGTPCGGSTVTAWTNNASSCTGAIAATTLTVASCTAGNLAVGLPITDANITAGTIITALGTGTGGAGTYTVNISQTAGSAVFTAPAWAFISKNYDQSGNSKDSAQATAANQPKLLLTCIGSLPCLSYGGAQWTSATITAVSQPFTFITVAERMGGFTSVMRTMDASQLFGYFSSTNTIYLGCGSNATATASDSVLHALVGVCNGASSVIAIDGSSNTVSAGASATNTALALGAISGGSSPLTGFATELGLWPIAFNSTQIGNMHTNQAAYYGTP
jgi:hypothetical protein